MGHKLWAMKKYLVKWSRANPYVPSLSPSLHPKEVGTYKGLLA